MTYIVSLRQNRNVTGHPIPFTHHHRLPRPSKIREAHFIQTVNGWVLLWKQGHLVAGHWIAVMCAGDAKALFEYTGWHPLISYYRTGQAVCDPCTVETLKTLVQFQPVMSCGCFHLLAKWPSGCCDVCQMEDWTDFRTCSIGQRLCIWFMSWQRLSCWKYLILQYQPTQRTAPSFNFFCKYLTSIPSFLGKIEGDNSKLCHFAYLFFFW